jgi:excisionase family DNA binding protein
MTDNGQDRILTVDQVAELVSVSAYTVRQWARDGQIPALRLGKYWRFRESSIRDWLAAQERPTRRSR